MGKMHVMKKGEGRRESAWWREHDAAAAFAAAASQMDSVRVHCRASTQTRRLSAWQAGTATLKERATRSRAGP